MKSAECEGSQLMEKNRSTLFPRVIVSKVNSELSGLSLRTVMGDVQQ